MNHWGSQLLSKEQEAFQNKFALVKKEVGKVIVGQSRLIDSLLIGLLADGHILIEGLPGLAKTLSVNTLSKCIQCGYKRIQFTPDLLPADLIGTKIYNPKEGDFFVKKGPIFTNILVADEINRSPAKVQSALLEVMQEKQVTISGDTFQVDPPFLVLATQNPIELEGTYPLPEAQTDRFMMKIKIDYPSFEEEKEILKRMGKLSHLPTPLPIIQKEDVMEARKIIDEIYIDERVSDYILTLISATRNPKTYRVNIDGYLQFGASPRASIALKLASKAFAFLSGRAYVTPQDVKEMAPDVLRHRLRLTYEAESEEISADTIIKTLLDAIAVP